MRHVPGRSRFGPAVALTLVAAIATSGSASPNRRQARHRDRRRRRVVLGFADGDDPVGWFQMSAGEKALAAGARLGLLGMGIGAGIGAASHVDSWEPLAVARRASDIARARAHIGARIAF